MDELLRVVPPEVGNHHLIHAVAAALDIPLEGLVEVVDDGPNLVVAICVRLGVVTEVETFHNRIEVVPADGLSNQDVPAVRFRLPHHVAVGKAMIAAVQKDTLKTPVAVQAQDL